MQSAGTTEISVIIPSYNSWVTLRKTLEALKVQETDFNFEVIVVDDGSTDETNKYIEMEFKDFEQLVYEKLDKNRGRSYARNKGIELSKGRKIVFIDADVVPADSSFLQAHWTILSNNSNDAVLGNLLIPNEIINKNKYIKFAFSRIPNEKGIKDTEEVDFKRFATGNVSISRELLYSLGLFDLGLNNMEDIDLGIRLHISGGKLLFSKNARAYHIDDRLNFKNGKERFESTGEKYYYKIKEKYPDIVLSPFIFVENIDLKTDSKKLILIKLILSFISYFDFIISASCIYGEKIIPESILFHLYRLSLAFSLKRGLKKAQKL